MKTATCTECGFTITGDTTEEVITKLNEHNHTEHPEMTAQTDTWSKEKRDEVMKDAVKDMEY